jgi:hypothetical protein
MADETKYDWMTSAALGADRRAVRKALTDANTPVATLLALAPAFLRVVAAAERDPQHAVPTLSLARDHKAREWVAQVAGATDVWTARDGDAGGAVRGVMKRAVDQIASWSDTVD